MNPKGYLIGNISSDPIAGLTSNSKSYCRFSVACNETFQRASEQPRAHFFNCVAWGARSEFIVKYAKKGDKVFLEFSMSTGSYTNKDGVLIKTVDIMVDNIELLTKKSSTSAPSSSHENKNKTEEILATSDNFEEDVPVSLEEIFNK